MDTARLFSTLELFSAEVDRAEEHLALQSGCSDWTIGQVIRHVVHVQREITLSLLRDEEPGRMLGMLDIPDDAAPEAWRAVAAGIRTVVGERQELTDRFVLPTFDATVHAWDLRAGLVAADLAEPLEFDSRTLTWLEAFKKHAPEELIRRPGMFGPEQPTLSAASPTTKFMAWAGRTSSN
ncbi:hypothetical protein [uncultured Agrococcus sp.]|uniref:hypothetical protein n=1 Tax=uncultured Agrococcus sp. TaxID=382258 RepID=UPI0025EEBCCD|nr:hypothetical protein [uncultured Agrococcus sp.]